MSFKTKKKQNEKKTDPLGDVWVLIRKSNFLINAWREEEDGRRRPREKKKKKTKKKKTKGDDEAFDESSSREKSMSFNDFLDSIIH